jgi:hypothetical protein
MNQREAEQLLGGYATGTLTEAERKALFSAALDHQELFDALMDEEALREVLADPIARARLLAVLPQAAMHPRKVQRLWRRPAVLGLVASLFVLVTTSYMVLRRPAPVLPGLGKAQQVEPGAPSPAAMAGTSPQTRAEPSTPVHGNAPPAKAKSLVPAKTGELAVPTLEADASLPGRGQDKEAKVDAVGAVAPQRALAAKPQDTPAPANYAVAESSGVSASDAAALAVRGGAKTEAAKRMKSASPSGEIRVFQVSPLEHLQGGRARLNVNWGPGGHLYLLKRSASTVAVLAPLAATLGQAGTHSTTFEFSLIDKDVLDVYLLNSPASDPAALPASAAIQGAWRRIIPE